MTVHFFLVFFLLFMKRTVNIFTKLCWEKIAAFTEVWLNYLKIHSTSKLWTVWLIRIFQILNILNILNIWVYLLWYKGITLWTKFGIRVFRLISFTSMQIWTLLISPITSPSNNLFPPDKSQLTIFLSYK